MYYYNARFYDPAIGRFISADSIVPDPTNTQDFNRYMYASGNPIKCLDPTGHDSEDSSSYYPGWYVSLCNYINSSWFGSALAYVSNAISSVTGYYAGYNYPGITPPHNLITANTGANNDPSKTPAGAPAVGGNIGSPVAESDGTGGPESTASKLTSGVVGGDEGGEEKGIELAKEVALLYFYINFILVDKIAAAAKANLNQPYVKMINDCDIWVQKVFKEGGFDITGFWGDAKTTTVSQHLEMIGNDNLSSNPGLGLNLFFQPAGNISHEGIVIYNNDGSLDVFHNGWNPGPKWQSQGVHFNSLSDLKGTNYFGRFPMIYLNIFEFTAR